MKILRMFDSLKFVRFVVAVVAIFAFVSAHAATLPAGYTELEYLESTGTQWIDTGYVLQSNDVTYEWTAEDLSTATNTSLFGSEQTEYPKYSGILYGSKTSRSLFVGNRSHAVTYSSDSGFHDWVLSLTNDHNATLYKDGTLISNVSFSGDLQKSMSIGVFNNHKSISNQYAKMMLKKFVIKDNNIVKVKLVPARRDSDGVLGMYDLADANPSTAFHTNVGTGEFVAGPAVSIKIATTRYNEEQFEPVETRLDAAVAAVDTVVSQTMTQAQAIDTIATTKQTRPDEGCDAKYCLLVEDEDGTPHWYPIAGANGVAHNLPAGYTELQYIESTGTQYIDTGLKLAAQQTPFLIDIDMSFNDKTGRYLMGFNDASPAYAGRYSNGTFEINTRYSTIKSGIDEKLNFQYGYFPELNNAIGIKVTKNGESEYLSSGRASMLAYNTNWYIFANNASNSSGTFVLRGKIYSAKAYKDNELVFNGIPAKNSSDVVGMYDMVSGQFFTNAGTGDFTAGPDM